MFLKLTACQCGNKFVEHILIFNYGTVCPMCFYTHCTLRYCNLYEAIREPEEDWNHRQSLAEDAHEEMLLAFQAVKSRGAKQVP